MAIDIEKCLFPEITEEEQEKLLQDAVKSGAKREAELGNILDGYYSWNGKIIAIETCSTGEIHAEWFEIEEPESKTTISQGCEMETQCIFCKKNSSIVAFMVGDDEGNAICASCVAAAQEKILENARATFMELDKTKRYVKLLEEKSGVLSLD